MYIDIIPNRNSSPAILLRESYRENGKVKKRTIANLSNLPEDVVEALKRILKGAVPVDPEDIFTIERSAAHGHIEAVSGTIKNIGLDYILSSKPCRERNLVLAMIIEQIIHPASKLGSVRLWPATTLAEELDVCGADEDDLYSAMDWLIQDSFRGRALN